MKSKPVVMDHFSTSHTAFQINFVLTNNITILMGNSGIGKTAVFSFIQECMAVNPQIFCLNYLEREKDIKKILEETAGKLIVIDNADILLDKESRKYISLDEKNQYLIIGRNPENLFAGKENFFELVSSPKDGRTEFTIKPYFD